MIITIIFIIFIIDIHVQLNIKLMNKSKLKIHQLSDLALNLYHKEYKCIGSDDFYTDLIEEEMRNRFYNRDNIIEITDYKES